MSQGLQERVILEQGPVSCYIAAKPCPASGSPLSAGSWGAEPSSSTREDGTFLNRTCGRNSAVECQLPKLDVAGSIPVARSLDSRIIPNVDRAAPCLEWLNFFLSKGRREELRLKISV